MIVNIQVNVDSRDKYEKDFDFPVRPVKDDIIELDGLVVSRIMEVQFTQLENEEWIITARVEGEDLFAPYEPERLMKELEEMGWNKL